MNEAQGEPGLTAPDRLPREIQSVETLYGTIRVKVARRAGFDTAAPEYDDCRRAAREHGVPLTRVYAATQQAWTEKGNKIGEPEDRTAGTSLQRQDHSL